MKKVLKLIDEKELNEILKNKYISQKKFEDIMEKVDLSDDEYEDLIEGALKDDIKVFHDLDEVIEETVEESFDDYYTQDIINQYFHDISAFDLLKKEDEGTLILKAKAGDTEAKEKVIMSNLRLVAKIALHYCKSGFYYLDLIQEGTIGLITAIDKFDVNKGYKFSTYATWWIKKEIIDALKKKVNMIKIPNYIYLMNKKIQIFEEDYMNKEGKKPNLEQVADALGICKSDIVRVKKAVDMNLTNLKYGEVKEEEDSVEIKDYSTINEIDSAINELQQRNRVSALLNKLNVREKRIIEMYYGLSEEGKYTFKEIGRELNISAERVRVLKERALGKLRYVGERLWNE
jgi:RNA polymerase sigma factor (sigma-70 family)